MPNLADPPELVLTDSPPALGAALSACFRRVRQCVLHWARPLERRVGLGPGECLRLCVGSVLPAKIIWPPKHPKTTFSHPQCHSLTFARPNSICDIFALRNGSGQSRLVHHTDFDYFEPRQDGQKLNDCWKGGKLLGVKDFFI